MTLEDISFDGVAKYVKEKGIIGWQDLGEAKRYHHLASICTKDIVELGAFMGLSTIFLMAGIRYGKDKARLTTVDHFKGSSEHPGLGYTAEMIREGFMKNIRESGFDSCISVLEMDTIEAAKVYPDDRVELLFIDASHEYELIKKDFEAWYPKVIKGGHIIIHDAATWPGPKQLYEEMLANGKLLPDTDWPNNPTSLMNISGFTIKP